MTKEKQITEERIELHCHSKAGGNATMSAGELHRNADMRNMPAIAITDRSSILAFPEMENAYRRGQYSVRPIYGMEMIVNRNGEISAVTVLIKNETGREALYRMISASSAETYPVFEWEELISNRSGLLIGSGASKGKLRQLALEGANDDVLKREMQELDYVEVLPYESDEKINARLTALCDLMGIPAVAVSDAHYIEKKDEAAWRVLNHSLHEDANFPGAHLLSTYEMIVAFSYLPEETIRKIVIDNTHKIAAQCESIEIMPLKPGYPDFAGADEELREICFEELQKKYDAGQRDEAQKRLEEELQIIAAQHMAFQLLQMKELLDEAGLRPCDVSIRGTAAGSMAVYLLGIGEVDPIRYGISKEIIFGDDGGRLIDIDLNVPESMLSGIHGMMGTLKGVGTALNAGSIRTLDAAQAEEMVFHYTEETGRKLTEEEKESITRKIVGNYTGHTRHPGGMILFPADCRISGLLPVQKLPDGSMTLYYEYFQVDDHLYKADVLGHPWHDALRRLAEKTGVDLPDVPVFSEEAMALFEVKEDGTVPGCRDLPGFDTEAIEKIIAKLKPKTFAQLVKISGLIHGSGVWTDNGENLTDDPGLGIDDLIADRDDIFDQMLSKGFDRAKAFRICDFIRKGRPARRKNDWAQLKEEMLKAGVPEWYTASCEKIRYLFPRAHEVSYLIMTMRFAWCKVHYAKEYAEAMPESANF